MDKIVISEEALDAAVDGYEDANSVTHVDHVEGLRAALKRAYPILQRDNHSLSYTEGLHQGMATALKGANAPMAGAEGCGEPEEKFEGWATLMGQTDNSLAGRKPKTLPDDIAWAESQREQEELKAKIDFVRKFVSNGVDIVGTDPNANRVAKASFEACIEYIDFLEQALVIGRATWQSRRVGWGKDD